MPPIVDQLSFDLPEEPGILPPEIQDILDRYPEMEIERMAILRRRTPGRNVDQPHVCVPAYDPYLRTSTCLRCGLRYEDCRGTKTPTFS